jgi:hypothetical protein
MALNLAGSTSLVRDDVTVRIPNPHRGDVGVALLIRIL